MSRSRNKKETPEKRTPRAESAPRSKKEKGRKKNPARAFETSAYAFATARDERLHAETELQALKQSIAFNTKRKVTSAQQVKLETALTRVQEAKEEEHRAAEKAAHVFQEEVPPEMEDMTSEEAFDVFLKSSDALRQAKEDLRALSPVTKNKKEQKARTEEVRTLAEKVASLEKENNRLRLAAMNIEINDHLAVPLNVSKKLHDELMDGLDELLPPSEAETLIQELAAEYESSPEQALDAVIQDVDTLLDTYNKEQNKAKDNKKKEAIKKEWTARLLKEVGAEAPDIEIGTLAGSEALEVTLVGYDDQIETLEKTLDNLKEEGASEVAIQEKALAIAELKEERAEVEIELKETRGREVAGTELAQGFDRVLEAAKNDPLLASTAESYSKLDTRRATLEKKIKKLTGHEAEDILIDPSLAGSFMKRVGQKVRGFFSKLAGTEPEPQADNLMREWKAVNQQMEELAQMLHPDIGFDHEKRAAGKLARTDEATEVHRALDREEATRRSSLAEQRDQEYLGQIELLADDVDHELREIELYDSFAQFMEHEDMHEANIAAFKERVSLLDSHKTTNASYGKQLKALHELVEELETRFNARLNTYEAEAQSAGKGKRVTSKIPGRAFGAGQPRTAFGTEALSAKHRRIEHLEEVGPKTELSKGQDAYMEDIRAYRKDKASEIRNVMQEYPPAAALWEQMSEVLDELLDPEEYEKISAILGTRDLATAYVLDVAFANMDKDKEAIARIAQVNRILLLPDDANIEKATKKKTSSKAKKKKGGKKKKVA